MTAKEYLEPHVRNIDTQLAQMRQQAAAHAEQAAKLSADAEALQKERDKAFSALESLKPKRKKTNG